MLDLMAEWQVDGLYGLGVGTFDASCRVRNQTGWVMAAPMGAPKHPTNTSQTAIGIDAFVL